ncbi:MULTISPECIES: hypothetical protein [Flavobacterium]|uniref:Lipoprotein n=1 Tax=Flavobacterium jumunjinense TaxID=998845 RepID=A0ABV5GHS8_9FLAO|nr:MULTISPECIES: hypothetical protein [Flavobacterium]
MKNALLFFCLLFVLSCKIDSSKTQSNIDSVFVQNTNVVPSMIHLYGPNLPSEPYELKLDIQQLNNSIYDLEIQMLLYNNAYYASPNTKEDLKGKFTFFIENNNSFVLKNSLIKTPLSNKKHESSTNDNGLTNWVRVNTSYNQQLEITTKEDFEVRGYIQFTIEPRCTLEKIPVIIEHKKGKLKFEIDNC